MSTSESSAEVRRPALLVTIDTEEEGLWSGSYRATGNTVENLKGIPWFQELCDSLDVQPTYLVDSPVVADSWGAALLRTYQEEGRAEVGAHLHPWCTQPHGEELSRRNSWMVNLPEDLQRRKLETLTHEIAEAMGRPPTSFRAGRYGMGTFAANVLVDLGYVVDSSVIPFTDYSMQSGPDFSRATWRPYRISQNDLLQQDTAGTLLEIPVTVGFNSHNFEKTWRRHQRFSRGWARHLRWNGILDRCGIGQRIKLSPEQASSAEMECVIRRALAQKADCLVLMFHSSSLVAGLSPYASTTQAFLEFQARMRDVLSFWRRDLGFPSPTMSQFAREWCSGLEPIPGSTR
ncbi:MAG: hypothetical protein ACK50P_03835 [Planctomycetaceae bacterium]|jgi:hypothetical protein